MPPSLDALLANLEATKSSFSPEASSQTQKLLNQFSRCEFSDAKSLLRFHEALLFLRAFAQSRSLVAEVEKILNAFHQRVEKLRRQGADMTVFDDFDTSGVAGTIMQDTLNFEAARWIAGRIPHNVEIPWDDYWDDSQSERASGATWPRFIPLLEEDADVEANIPWPRWLDAARGRDRDLPWLVRQFEALPRSDRERAELYDSLRLPIRWRLENLKLSRTRNRTRPHRFFFHHEPLITRGQVSPRRENSASRSALGEALVRRRRSGHAHDSRGYARPLS